MALSSCPLPLKRDKLNNRTCLQTNPPKNVNRKKIQLQASTSMRKFTLQQTTPLHPQLLRPQAHRKFQEQILYKICLQNAQYPQSAIALDQNNSRCLSEKTHD